MAYPGYPWYFWNPLNPVYGAWPLGVWGPYLGRRRRRRRGRRRHRRKYAYDDNDGGYDTYGYHDNYGGDDYGGDMYAGSSISTKAHAEEYYHDELEFPDEYENTLYADADISDDDDYDDSDDDYDDEMKLKGFQRITPDEYFSAVINASSSMTLDNVKHMRLVAQSGHKIAMNRGDSEIATGFIDILNAMDDRIAQKYDVDHVDDLDVSDLSSEATLLSQDLEEQANVVRKSRTSILDALADEHDPVELLNRFKVEGKRWKKYALPRFSKGASVPDDYDHRRIIEDHDHLTYFYAITKHMQNFASGGKISVFGGRSGKENVSKEFTKYTETLSNGMQVSLRNQLRNWRSGIKFLVIRGVANMYGEEYGRSLGSVEKTQKIKSKFTADFNKVMQEHIKLEKKAIDFESAAWLKGETKDDSDYSKKSKELRDALILHATEDVSAFWTGLVLFSMGQPQDAMRAPIGESIKRSFAQAWTTHVDKTIAFVKTLANTGFQKDPVKLKSDMNAMFSDGNDLGTLINSYVYGMAGETVPNSVVHSLMTIVEI